MASRFQFSLRTLLASMLLLAIVCAAYLMLKPVPSTNVSVLIRKTGMSRSDPEHAYDALHLECLESSNDRISEVFLARHLDGEWRVAGYTNRKDLLVPNKLARSYIPAYDYTMYFGQYTQPFLEPKFRTRGTHVPTDLEYEAVEKRFRKLLQDLYALHPELAAQLIKFQDGSNDESLEPIKILLSYQGDYISIEDFAKQFQVAKPAAPSLK